MSDSFEFTLHSPLAKEDWNKITDAEHEHTMYVTFQTPQGRQVKYIKCEVLDKIRAEIEQHRRKTQGIDPYDLVGDCLDIIDEYKGESGGEVGESE